MSKLTSKERNALPTSEFALPGERKFPIPDASHARNALARASQQKAKGNLSESGFRRVTAMANAKLGK